eukprot:TRINITY_DN785_c2_g1_i2.p1 TRINITY_DN785_c2_g1~~TRINITY_DN785_c2_g1_i2.p1  ORF type:complete len:481 (+),score=107.57 TRINITY_DN785_c2_g1_i2:54-1445(+)
MAEAMDVDVHHFLEDMLANAEDAKSVEMFRKVILCTDPGHDDLTGIKVKEAAVSKLGNLLVEKGDIAGIKQLLLDVRPFFQIIAKSKTAKIVKALFHAVSRSGVSKEDQVVLVEEFINWSREEKRSFLRHRLQTRLGELRFELELYTEALAGVNALLREVRKLDDKSTLVDVHLLESRIYYALKNQSKAKAGLIAARTAAHSIYVAPLTQAEIDMQSGIIGAEEKEYKVAYSYFFEAFEGFNGTGEHREAAEFALKYMLMTKILDESLNDITQILQQKSVLKYRDLITVKAMKDIAAAHKGRDLHRFKEVRTEYASVFDNDPIAEAHLEDMYHSLLERHLLRVIEPYERVEITHLAKLISLDDKTIEAKLSQMILDEKLHGILDQANRCLIVYQEDTRDSLYPDALETLENVHKVIDALFDKCAGKFIKKEEEKDKKEKDEKKDEKGDDSKKADETKAADEKK